MDMRSQDIPSPDSISPASFDLDRDATVVVRMTLPEQRPPRFSKGTVAIALSLMAFACTFVGAGWSAATHAPVARAAGVSVPAPTLDAPVAVDIRSEPSVVTVPVIELSAPPVAGTTRTRGSSRTAGTGATPPRKPTSSAPATPALAPATPPTPALAPEVAKVAPRPAAKPSTDTASVRELNATASAVLESSL
ncbi:MAG TPA: hypothetical protein VIF15_18505 [Polyangiaceae bacterium]